MSNAVQARALTVCVFSSHPVVLDEFQQFISKPRFSARPMLVDQVLSHDLVQLPVPPAAVYVVDSNAPFPVVLVTPTSEDSNLYQCGYIMWPVEERPELKPLHWVGSSKKDLLALPEEVADIFGYAFIWPRLERSTSKPSR